jgi:uncharacterized repeat protein (TIGR03803 family)
MVLSARWTLSFVMVVLVLGLAAPAAAQSGLVCTANAAVVPTLRQEGFTELTGDVLLECTGAPASQPTPTGVPIPQATISVSLNVPVTSRIVGGASPALLTEALLLVDDPSPANQDVCLSPTAPELACQVLGDGGQTFNKPGKFNVFQGLGSAASPNSVTFLGVPIDPPLVTRTYRITNIRIDATGATGGVDGLIPVVTSVSASPATSMQISNPQTYVAFISGGLTQTTSASNPPFLQCQTYPTTKVGSVTFAENFATAFRVKTDGVQNTPGVVYFSESGLEIAVTGGQAGAANTGTRLQTLISNIPQGVSIYVDNWALSLASECPQVCSDATLATGPATPTDPGMNTVTQVTSGAESSVLVQWEVTNTNSFALDTVTFNVYASVTGMPSANQPVGALSGFSPQLAAYASAGPIPEFSSTVDLPVSATTLFTISPCPTISGQVTVGGAGLGGVEMSLSGSQSGTATTNVSGNYSFAVPPGGNYTITPSLSGYAFTPPSEVFDTLSDSETANFIAQVSLPTLRTIYNFTGGSGGAYPRAGVAIGSGGSLYGTTAADGASNHGVVFSLTPSPGGTWSEAILHSFTGASDGSDPQTGVVIGKGGAVYGTAGGTVFSLTPPASHGAAWTETVLYGIPGAGSLVIGSNGLLYGTAAVGGTSNLGTVFSLTPPASPGGAWAETVLHNFTGGTDGSSPLAGVAIGAEGVLYGTTDAGGTKGYGTVFSLTPPASPGGAWTETVLYNFTGGSGAHPKGGVAIGSGGGLYGTTYSGGASNLGTVFSLLPPASRGGAWVKSVLHDFTGAAGEGAHPSASVVIGNDGALYGTTAGGGSASCNSGGRPGCGTIFSLAPPASRGGLWTETILYSFTGDGDGSDPQAGLAIGAGGALYGTTTGGGAFNNGTVFVVIP